MKRKPVKTQPVVQVMPERRVRLDPSTVPSFASWLVAVGQRWQRMSRRTTSGLVGVDRVRRQKEIQFGQNACKVIQMIIDEMMNTVSLDDYDAAHRVWHMIPDDAISSPGTSSDSPPTLTIPGLEG